MAASAMRWSVSRALDIPVAYPGSAGDRFFTESHMTFGQI
jgi:hypothetical protein